MGRQLLTLMMALCIGLSVAAVPPTQTRPTTLPLDDARQLFLDTLGELHSSKNLTLQVLCSQRYTAAEPVTRPDHQAGTNTIEEGTLTFLIQRPDKLRFECRWVPQPSGIRYEPVVIFDHESVLVAFPRKTGGPLEGSFGEMKNKSVDDILRSNDCRIEMTSREMTYLLDSQSYDRFFRFATGWEWAGAATDNSTKVWRVKFVDASSPPKSWEAWITQDKPRRFTRLMVGGPSTMGFIEYKPKPGETLPSDDSFDDPSKFTRTASEYKADSRVELRFTKWDTTTALKPSDFERPAGKFTERPFQESEPTYKLGDVVPLPPLTDVDGRAVDLSKHTGPIVLDFWFAACGPCMYWTPRVEALADEFAASGIELYGINGIDTPAKAKQVAAKQGWKHVTSLIDAGQKYALAFSVTGYPTVVVISADGKLLYRDFPGDDAAMDRLKDVLQKATERTIPATQPAADSGKSVGK